MNKLMHGISALMLAAGIATTSAYAADVVGETQRCVRLRQIESSPIIDDRTILVKMRGTGFKRIDLNGTCSGISWDGYARSGPEDSICITDALHVNGPVGNVCTINKIVNIDAQEAAALQAKKR